MSLGRKVDGGSNYKCSDFEDRERILERITMNITFEPCVKVQNENRKIFVISLGDQVKYQVLSISLRYFDILVSFK